eukprot:5948684-Amphidinium_carterae.1
MLVASSVSELNPELTPTYKVCEAESQRTNGTLHAHLKFQNLHRLALSAALRILRYRGRCLVLTFKPSEVTAGAAKT